MPTIIENQPFSRLFYSKSKSAMPLKIYWNLKNALPSVAQAQASIIEYP
jgi:hypothetical protein